MTPPEDSARPDDTRPDDTQPDDTRPDDTRPDDTQPDEPGEPDAKRVVRSLGTGISCLVLLVVTLLFALVVVPAFFFNEPALSIAVLALIVAVAAYRSRRRGS